jgi:hypothetical protein
MSFEQEPTLTAIVAENQAPDNLPMQSALGDRDDHATP